MISGTIKYWKSESRFGFIKPDGGGGDIFFHVSALPAGVNDLDEGQAVTFEIGPDEKTGKQKAVTVDLI